MDVVDLSFSLSQDMNIEEHNPSYPIGLLRSWTAMHSIDLLSKRCNHENFNPYGRKSIIKSCGAHSAAPRLWQCGRSPALLHLNEQVARET